MKYSAPRGTYDRLPPSSRRFEIVTDRLRSVLEAYGLVPVETPVFEASELFSRSIGTETDIVSKEMYTFTDRKGRSLTLRPEGTAGVVRAYVEHSLDQMGLDRFYYLGPMFRYERPQAGRQRQFTQLGVEIFGDAGPEADAETVDLFVALCRAVGLTGLSVQLNSVGCPECRAVYSGRLRESLAAKSGGLCADCRRRLETNAMRVFDCKVESCAGIVADVPTVVDTLCGPCSEHYTRVRSLLERLGIPYQESPKLVRGLDYYTRTAFEIQIPGNEGAQNAVGGGGRYDLLVEQLGGRPTPAIGFAIGLERLLALMDAQGVGQIGRTRPLVYVAAVGDEGRARGLGLVTDLRARGAACLLDRTRSANLGKQFKEASRRGARLVAVIAEDEIAHDTVAIKDMQSREQVTIPSSQAAQSICDRLAAL